MWYLSYRLDGLTRMRIFKTRRLAFEATCEMLNEQATSDLEVGPMLESRDGNVVRGDQLRRFCETGMP